MLSENYRILQIIVTAQPTENTMKFIAYASGTNPARPSTRNPETIIPASTWILMSRFGHGPDAEKALADVNLAKYGAERISPIADLVRKDEKNRLVPATPPHETDKDRGDVLVDVTDVFPHGVREADEPVLDDDGKAILDGQGKPTTRKVKELRLRLLVA